MKCDNGVLYDDGGPVNKGRNCFYNCRECTAPTPDIHRQIQIGMKCDDKILYDDEGPVNRWQNTFYNHREHTASTSLSGLVWIYCQCCGKSP